MIKNAPSSPTDMIGIGLYTPAEAGNLLRIAPAKISRWLKGHEIAGRHYEPLWRPQVNLGDDSVCLGFRDLQEVRVAATFIAKGLSAIFIRQAIGLARDLVGTDHPLSTTRFRTDGRSIFLQVVAENGETSLIDVVRKQFAFREIIEQSLTNVDYDTDGNPAKWWPLGKAKRIVLDPERSFGQPIEADTSVPVDVLVAAIESEGSAQAAARVYDVPLKAVQRAAMFRKAFDRPLAA